MFISVLISSINRASSLNRTLESLLCPATLERTDWELILVTDSGTGEDTLGLGNNFAERFPDRFRFLIQEGHGKSNAMNLAICQARGDVLAMIDDDVVCSSDYLDGIRSVFADASIYGAQGRIFLDCEGGLPEWMGDDLARFMSLRDCGDQQLEWNENLAGTNMVVRGAVMYEVGGYAPELGAGSLGYCEDSELSVRIRGAGFRLVYAPQVVVYHKLSRARLTKGFFRKRFFGFGRSQAYYIPLSVPLWRFSAYTMKKLLRTCFLAFWNSMRGRASASFSLECNTLTLAGFTWQHLQFRRGISPRLSHIEIRRPTISSESPALSHNLGSE